MSQEKYKPQLRERGYTLVELMISLTLGALVMGSVLTGYSKSTAVYTEFQKNSVRNEDGRYALDKLRQDMVHAGFYGDYYSIALGGSSIPDPCDTGLTDIQSAMAFPVVGYNIGSPSVSPLSCLKSTDLMANSDIIVIRRASTSVLEVGDLPELNGVYLQANSMEAELQLGDPTNFAVGKLKSDNSVGTVGTEASGNTATILKKMNQPAASPSIQTKRIAADIRKYYVHAYFVAPCATPADGGLHCTGSSDDNGRPIPTLKRLELTTDGSGVSVTIIPIALGVEQLQVDYGLDSSGSDAVGSGVPNTYSTAPVLTDWANVVSAKVYLLMRNLESTPGYTGEKIFNLGLYGYSKTPSDSYKRKLYNATVRFVNLAARKELPL